MTSVELVDSLASLASIAALWVLVMWLYRTYRVDRFRQDMFALRDELFDLAAEGRIGFAHPAYRMLRDMHNGYIRFGHRLSLSSVLLFLAMMDPKQRNWLKRTDGFAIRFRRASQNLDSTLVRELNAQQARMHELVAGQIVLGSPLLILTILPVATFLLLMRLPMASARLLRHKIRNAIADNVDEAALALGGSA